MDGDSVDDASLTEGSFCEFLPKLNDHDYNKSRRPLIEAALKLPISSDVCGGFRLFCRKFRDQDVLDVDSLGAESTGHDTSALLNCLALLRSKWKDLTFVERELFNDAADQPTRSLLDRPVITDPAPVDAGCLPCLFCPEPTERFLTAKSLCLHISSTHQAKHLFVCHLCHRVFLTRGQLVEHLKGYELNSNSIRLEYFNALAVCTGCGAQLCLALEEESLDFGQDYVNLFLNHHRSELALVYIFSVASVPASVTFFVSAALLSAREVPHHNRYRGITSCPDVPEQLRRICFLRNVPDVGASSGNNSFGSGFLIPTWFEEEMSLESDDESLFSSEAAKILIQRSREKSPGNDSTGVMDRVTFDMKPSFTKYLTSFNADGCTLVDDLFQCPSCFYLDFDLRSFKKHAMRCTGEKEVADFQVHTRYFVSNLGILCAKCGVRCCSVLGLQLHFLMEHDVDVVFRPHGYSTEASTLMQLERQAQTHFDYELGNAIDQAAKEKAVGEPEKVVSSRMPFTLRMPTRKRRPQVPMVVVSSSDGAELGAKTRRRIPKSTVSPSSKPSTSTSISPNADAADTQEKKTSTRRLVEESPRVELPEETPAAPVDGATEPSKADEPVAQEAPDDDILIIEEETVPVSPDAHADELFECLLCGVEVRGRWGFVNHLQNHEESFACCPVCSEQNVPTEMLNALDFFDHLLADHLRDGPVGLHCPLCNQSCGATVSRLSVSRAVNHVLYECTRARQCMLCACRTDVGKKMFETLKLHRSRSHAGVFNRFYCGRCLVGMHSCAVFARHQCSSVSFRCICDPALEYQEEEALREHVREHSSEKHAPVDAMVERALVIAGDVVSDPAVFTGEAGSKRPSRSRVDNFFDKYPFLEKTVGASREPELLSVAHLEASRRRRSPSVEVLSTAGSSRSGAELEPKKEPAPDDCVKEEELLAHQEAQKERRALQKRKRRMASIEEPDQRKRRYQPSQLKMLMDCNIKCRELCRMDVATRGKELDVAMEVCEVVEDLVATVCDKFAAAASGSTWTGPVVKHRARSAPRKASLTPGGSGENSVQNGDVQVAGSYRCMYSGKHNCPPFAEPRLLHSHFMKDHAHLARHPIPIDRELWMCPMCMTACTALQNFENHMKRHTNVADCVWCPHCPLLCSSVESFAQHNQHHKDKKVVFVCSEHRFSFQNAFVYFVHLETHGVKVLKFCKMCGYANTSVRTVMAHIDKCNNKRFRFGEPFARAFMALSYCPAGSVFLRKMPSLKYMVDLSDRRVRLASPSRCDHANALFSQGGPHISCLVCYCPIPDVEWCKLFPDHGRAVASSLLVSGRGSTGLLQKLVHSVSKDSGRPEAVGNDVRLIPRLADRIEAGFVVYNCAYSETVTDAPAENVRTPDEATSLKLLQKVRTELAAQRSPAPTSAAPSPSFRMPRIVALKKGGSVQFQVAGHRLAPAFPPAARHSVNGYPAGWQQQRNPTARHSAPVYRQ